MTVTAMEANGEGMHILVVDDDPGVREMCLKALRNRGYQAEGAEDGVQALHHLQHGHFDVVLTDLQMPRMDGLALLHEIRRLGYLQPVVFQTTLLDASLETALRRAGASDVLMKGGPFRDLVRSVEEASRASGKPRARCA